MKNDIKIQLAHFLAGFVPMKILLTVIALFSTSLHAQKIVQINATSQNWSGGICCIYGTYYNFSLRIYHKGMSCSIDTLWLEGVPFTEKESIIRRKECFKKRYCDVEIYANVRKGHMGSDINPPQELPVIPESPYSDPTLVLHIGNKRIVYHFTNIAALPPLAYP